MQEIEHLFTYQLDDGTVQGDSNFGKPEWEITFGEHKFSYSGFVGSDFWRELLVFVEEHDLRYVADEIIVAVKAIVQDMDAA